MARVPQEPGASDSQKLTLDVDVRLKGHGLTIPLARIGAAIGGLVAVIWLILRSH